jgi:hypothetical protein
MSCVKIKQLKMIEKEIQLFLIIVLTLVFASSFVSAVYNVTENETILACIDNVDSVVSVFEANGFNIVRLVDLRLMIEGSYSAGISYDSVVAKCNDVDKIYIMAFDARDYTDALTLFYDEIEKENVDMSSVDEMIIQINLEFENERYERIERLVDATYDEIIEIQSSNSALMVFYESTSNKIISFFEDHYKEFSVFVLFLLLMYLIFKKSIRSSSLRQKIRRRELRKDIIKDLIKKTQKQYFSHGKMSEGMYSIRIRKFSEIVRNLDKEIFGFREELLKLWPGKVARKKEVKKKKMRSEK